VKKNRGAIFDRRSVGQVRIDTCNKNCIAAEEAHDYMDKNDYPERKVKTRDGNDSSHVQKRRENGDTQNTLPTIGINEVTNGRSDLNVDFLKNGFGFK
jgi:hypothetical protein